MKLTSTQYTGSDEEYNYTFSFIKETWRAIRIKKDKPGIPPYMEMLTNGGWVHLLKPSSPPVAKFETIDDCMSAI